MNNYTLDYKWRVRGAMPSDFVFDVLRDGRKVAELSYDHGGEDQRIRRPQGLWGALRSPLMGVAWQPKPPELWPPTIRAIEAFLESQPD